MFFISATLPLLLFASCLGRTVEHDNVKIVDLPVVYTEAKASFNLDAFLTRLAHSPREPPCPDEEVIAPCLCSVNGDGEMTLECSAVESEDQLAGVFQQDLSSNSFRTLYINNNNDLKSIGDIFNGVTFVEFIGTNIVNLESIADNAFAASVDTLEVMYLTNTNLTETGFPFATISDYSVLREIAIFFSSIEKMLVPLQSDSLEELRIFDSLLHSFNAGIFDNLKNLKRFEMSQSHILELFNSSVPIVNTEYGVFLYHNYINTVEPGVFVMPAETDSLTVYLNLAQNYISVLEESVFGEIFPYVTKFTIYGNPLACGCDMAWLVTNHEYFSKVDGAATCANGTKLAVLDPKYYLENCPAQL